ncbi:hypothetical protein GCM10020255_022200 [Rhodococcus baikonurensis]|nr:hypothetical protein GA0061093_12939 [Rhodococcus qingshengii]
MPEGREALDRTHVMNHRNRMWQLGKELSLVSIGGIDAQLATVSVSAAAVAGVILLPIGFAIGKTFLTVVVGALVVLAVTYAFCHWKWGNSYESPFQFVRMSWARIFRNPDLISGGASNKNPGKLEWTAIVWRPDWAQVNLESPLQRPVYDPKPVGTGDFFPKRKARVTFDQLLGTSNTTNYGQETQP